ncbi:MAG: aldo/keto reductase [bacterium]|nr:aldo/keto reductase [bacterium]
MLYRKMKKNGDELSVLGFGCMRLPEIKGKIDEERAFKQIRMAIDQGVNYIDTAMPYHMGASEPFLAKVLADGYREKVKLATKLPPWSVKQKEDMDLLLTAQLKRLNAGHIDYYLIHALERDNWKKMQDMGVLEFLNRAKKDGKIINAGFSFHGDKETFKEIVDGYDWDMCLIQYNFLDEENQAGTEGLKYASAKGMGVFVMEPLRGGNLAGKVPPAVEAAWDEAEVKRTPAEWALRWVWNHKEVNVVLSGMNDESHIRENLRIAGEAKADSLTEKELKLVTRVRDTYRKLMKAECTGCQYCMPCPAGVNIPMCFETYNSLHMFANRKEAVVLYIINCLAVLHTERNNAGLCVKCGKCEEACPQHLPVQQLLKEVADEFEKPKIKILAVIFRVVMKLQRRGILRKSRK